MEGEESLSRITRVPVSVDTRAPGGMTNAYLVDGLLVDPAARTADLDAAVADHAPHIEAVAVTHTHPDHVGAVAAYAAETDATVCAHAAHADRFLEATGVAPDETLADGDEVGDTGVVAWELPGHAPDHLGFAVGVGDERSTVDVGSATTRALLCGDLAVAEGSVVVGVPDGDLVDYLASLERVRDAGFDRLYSGHGPVIENPEDCCSRLIDHRLRREERVLNAVETGASDVDAVLDAAYEKDLTGVEDLARATVRAHLRKLADEGRIGAEWSAK